MSIIRYSSPVLSSPWPSLNRLNAWQDEVARLFTDAPAAPASGWVPPLDLSEEGDAFQVQVEVPGLRPEDVHLQLEDGVLTLSGERPPAAKTDGTRAFRSERASGKFRRTVSLPSAVDGSRVTARYQHGILTVTLPKSEEAKPRRIEVTVA